LEQSISAGVDGISMKFDHANKLLEAIELDVNFCNINLAKLLY
jgi:hypothetical protein